MLESGEAVTTTAAEGPHGLGEKRAVEVAPSSLKTLGLDRLFPRLGSFAVEILDITFFFFLINLGVEKLLVDLGWGFERDIRSARVNLLVARRKENVRQKNDPKKPRDSNNQPTQKTTNRPTKRPPEH